MRKQSISFNHWWLRELILQNIFGVAENNIAPSPRPLYKGTFQFCMGEQGMNKKNGTFDHVLHYFKGINEARKRKLRLFTPQYLTRQLLKWLWEDVYKGNCISLPQLYCNLRQFSGKKDCIYKSKFGFFATSGSGGELKVKMGCMVIWQLILKFHWNAQMEKKKKLSPFEPNWDQNRDFIKRFHK